MRRIVTVACLASATLGATLGTSAQAAHRSAAAPAAVRTVSAEVRIVGKVTKITDTKITIKNATRTLTFVVPARISLNGIKVGQRVEAEGRRVNGTLRLTKIHRENSPAAGADDNGGGNSNGGGDDSAPSASSGGGGYGRGDG